MEVGQSLQVILGIHDIHTMLRHRHQTFQENRRHESPLADHRRIVIHIEYIQDLIRRLIVPVLRSMMVVKDESVPVVQAGISYRMDEGCRVERMLPVFVPLAEHKRLSLHNGNGSET